MSIDDQPFDASLRALRWSKPCRLKPARVSEGARGAPRSPVAPGILAMRSNRQAVELPMSSDAASLRRMVGSHLFFHHVETAMVALLSSPSSASLEPKSPLLSGRVIDAPGALESLVPAWRNLVGRCAWRNPCYEPEFLIPLLKHCGDESARLLVIEGASASDEIPQLYGVMPLVTKSFYRLPFHCVHAWRPDEAFDSTRSSHHSPNAACDCWPSTPSRTRRISNNRSFVRSPQINVSSSAATVFQERP